MDRPAQTALGSARSRFVEGLPRRARELRAAAEHLGSAPSDPQVREEMRRRLHALYATAQVFEEETLARAVKDVIARLDTARDAGRSLDDAGLERLRNFAESLPEYVSDEAHAARASRRTPVDDPTQLDEASAAASSTSAELPPASAEADEDDQARMINHSVAGFVPAPAVTGVLVVDSPAVRACVRELLPEDQFEVWGTSDPEEAVRLLHVDSPDFVFVSGELAAQPEIELVRRLQTDPLSDVRAVYVLLPEGAAYDSEFLRQTGADGVLVAPFDAMTLTGLVEARTRFSRRAFGALSALTQGTADDVAQRVADEIRRGIADALQAGRSEKIQFDDASELMAVAWSAIGRVRSHLVEQSRGRIRFRTEAFHEAPALLPLDAAPQTLEPDAQLGAVLQGRRVLVADDDPAVLWFFSGLAREAGAQVLEAHDGRQALELARLKHPDVVVTDILMPKIDGFALCREIKRDVMLWHLPVILLSWKEDFLQRMRELDSGANGYLRKEAGSRQILAGLADVLRPLARLEAHLATGDEVRGRVEGLGVLPLLQTLAARRPDARLTVRDAWNMFEVDLRGGKTLAVTRTASDGSFARGEAALMQLLGVGSGRFAINSSDAPLRAPLVEPFERAVLQVGKRLAALLDAVSDSRLLQVARVAFDDEVVASLLSSTPTPLAEVVARFRDGTGSAKDMLLEGTFSPGDLADYLRELARRGAIVGVWDTTGEDLVALAAREREQQPGTLLHASHPPRPVQSTLAGESSQAATRPSPTPAVRALFADDESEQASVAESAARSSPSPGAAGAADWLGTAAARPRDALAASEESDELDSDAEPVIGQLPTWPPAGNTRHEGLVMLLTAAALMATGYFGWQQLERRQRSVESYRVSSAVQAPRPATVAEAPPPAAALPGAEPTTAPSAVDPADFGRVLSYIDPRRGVAVPSGQGLFVVDFEGEGHAPRISDGEHELGTPPIAVALPAGRHELRLHRGDEVSVRYLFIKPGQTRWVTLSAASD